MRLPRALYKGNLFARECRRHFATTGPANMRLQLRYGWHVKLRMSAKARASLPVAASKPTSRQFLLSIYRDFSEDRIPAVAGGITFFILLAIFPAIGSVVALYDLFCRSRYHHAQFGLRFLPEGGLLSCEAHFSDWLHKNQGLWTWRS